jgi:hypothetical protein
MMPFRKDLEPIVIRAEAEIMRLLRETIPDATLQRESQAVFRRQALKGFRHLGTLALQD